MALTLDHTLDRISSSSQRITIGITGGLVMPAGSTAQRPSSPQQGTVRYNTTLGQLEVYDSSLTWQPLSGGGGGTPGAGGDEALIFALIFGS